MTLHTAPARPAAGTAPDDGLAAEHRRKVLVVGSFARLAGAQIAAIRVAAGLRDRGHDARLAFLYEIERLEAPGGYAVMLPRARPSKLDYLRIAWNTFRHVRRERPDVVISFLPLASVLAHGAGALAGVSTRVVSYRTTLDSAYTIPRWLDVACAWAGVYTDAIFVARAVKDTAPHHPRSFLDRAAVVHNGLWDFHPSPLSREDARRRFAIPDGAFALVSIGRLAAQKNYPTLIRMMARLPECILLIAGEGALRGELEALARDSGVAERVRFLGVQPRAEIPHLLAAADALVQSSLYEGQSNTVLEALAAGAPVVAHDIPEQREVLVDETTGRSFGTLVAVDDIEGWVAAVEALRRDSSAHAAAREASLVRAGRFTFGAMIDGFEAVVRRRPPRRRR